MNEISVSGGTRIMKRVKIVNFLSCVVVVALVSVVVAQAPPEPGPMIAGAGPVKSGMIGMHLENNMDIEPVKGVPFSATVSTEHTQTFADGNRIHTNESSTVYRDGEGRTRHEAGLNLLGAGSQAPAPKLITIDDPVAGVRYILDTENKVAHKMPFAAGGGQVAGQGPVKSERMWVYQSTGGTGPQTFSTNVLFAKKMSSESDAPAPTTDSLGDQTINGIHATGTRMTTTIPSGKMGNDKPINVSSERWYSSELKATVMTKHEDPWAGELKTEFTSVNTSEPDASLFTVPSDYKVVDDKNGPVTFRMAGPPPPPQ
jgi:hypothetical protein